ncbi:elongation factor EF-2 [Candidatus Micrarchaeota archaeon]|nr:elongation factor EF-2 [Candidatus Micrarchaeota archaeon]
MAKKENIVEMVERLMGNRENIRNIAIVAHVDHGKTTLSDSLVARAGLMSKELAGEQRVLDYDEQEQARGITIKSANISLAFPYQGKDYLINLIDTPGHVDFGGHVTRAMRAVDGVIVVIDAVEGVMPQTETVLRQAIKERAKPVIFINKVDRLISEMRLTPEDMQKRLIKIVLQVNKLIGQYAPKEFKDAWKVSVENGTISFGSAFHKWAVSANSMKRTGLGFKDIIELTQSERVKELQEKTPVDEIILEMAIHHLPNPLTAQKYRIPHLWKGDIESQNGKDMIECNPDGKPIGVCFGVMNDPHAGEVALVRLFSGTVKKGDQLYLASTMSYEKIQQLGIYMGKERVVCNELTAGNIAGIVGLKDVYVGETISSEPVEPFEEIKHYSEPVITKSIEAKNSKDLSKLIQALRAISKEDPTIRVKINQETGEHLISGMGELHLEIIEYKLKNEKKIDIVTSPPIVVYRETIHKKGPEVEGKSPNKHTKLLFSVEPLEPEFIKAIDEGKVSEGKAKGKASIEEYIAGGLQRDEAKRTIEVFNKNVLIDATRGVQYLNEIMELVRQGFEEAMSKGPLAQEKVVGVKVKILDGTIHEDPVHRGPAQILPTVRNPIYSSLLQAGVIIQEPKQKVLIQVPQEFSGAVINLVNGKRGQLLNMEQEGEVATLHFKIPVAEMFGFSSDLRSTTQGKAIWYQEYAGYEDIPRDLQKNIVHQIRKRKGLKPEPPEPKDFVS